MVSLQLIVQLTGLGRKDTLLSLVHSNYAKRTDLFELASCPGYPMCPGYETAFECEHSSFPSCEIALLYVQHHDFIP